ncbi:MAG TPA: TonB-dependent receptor [Puia sp.]|nr:TonB-dependent receptor [Puia sp.]
MKREQLLICTILALVYCARGFSQAAPRITITGTVTNSQTNAPLEGVTIGLKGGKGLAITKQDGTYQLTLDSRTVTLVFSSVGFAATEIAVRDRHVIDVSLTPESKGLDDIVVVGYQTKKRRDLTGAVSSIGAKDLKDVPLNSAAEALQGRLAGVQVVVSEGAPNADVDVFIRGRNGITSTSAPLYVVDGIQVDNALSVISPQDIESIDVLKDAASTAIYGARGSNGVVIITTKGGKNTGGKTTVTLNTFAGVTELARELKMMDPYNFVLYSYERAKYTENPLDTSIAAQYIRFMGNFDTIQNYKHVHDVDWQKTAMGRAAFQTTENLSVSGGNEKTQFNLSTTYNLQQGLVLNSNFYRKLVNFRFDHKVSDKLRMGFNVRYNDNNVTGAGTSDVGGAGSNRLRQYVRYRPILLPGQTIDYYDPSLDANNPGNGLNLVNPLQLQAAEYRNKITTAYDYNGYLNFNFTPKLTFRSTFGYDVYMLETDAYDDTLTGNSRTWSRMPDLTVGNNKNTTINNSNVFTYANQSLGGSKHGLEVLVGQEIYQTNVKTRSVETRYFPVGTAPKLALSNLGLATPPAGLTEPKPASTEVNTTQFSLFGRIGYDYARKYLLTLNFRADGSSLFGPDYSSPIPATGKDHKWGYFPSAAVAWRISQENFMQRLTFISDAKIRLSYGQAGNNRISAYGYTTGYVLPSNGGYGLNDVLNYTFATPSQLGNPSIKWETTTSRNLGFDLGLFNNRLSATIDLYSNTTDNLLIANAIPATSGYTTQYQNVGSTRNNGLEVQLSGTILRTKDFSWTGNFNISFNQNKITSLGSQQSFTANSGWFSTTANPNDYLIKVGQQVGTMYGLKVDGMYKVSDFDVTPYVNATNNARYPNLTYQYTLKKGLPNPSAVLSDLVAPGQIKYRDANGDGKITLDSDRVVIGHALPKFTGGFGQQFVYRNFDASVFINFVYGNQIMNANKLEFSTQYGVDGNMLALMDDRWKVIDQDGNLVQKQPDAKTVIAIAPDQLQALNAKAKIWQPIRTTTGFYPSSFAVEDGSYIRINNITIGYSLPKQWIRKFGVSNLRAYITGTNIATLTGYSGFDPDVSTRRSTPLTPGVDYGGYPRGRTFLFGLNVSF